MFSVFHHLTPSSDLKPVERDTFGDTVSTRLESYGEALSRALAFSRDHFGYVHVQDSSGYLIALFSGGCRVGLQSCWGKE